MRWPWVTGRREQERNDKPTLCKARSCLVLSDASPCASSPNFSDAHITKNRIRFLGSAEQIAGSAWSRIEVGATKWVTTRFYAKRLAYNAPDEFAFQTFAVSKPGESQAA